MDQKNFEFPPINKLWKAAYYQDEPRFNGEFSRDNLSNKIKDGAYVINIDLILELIGWLCMEITKLLRISILLK